MLRLPRSDGDEALLFPYGLDEALDYEISGDHVIITWTRSDEDGGGYWEEGEGWMARLAPIREELERGDHRALYLGWLYGVGAGLADEEDAEPPLPAGLGALTAAQMALVEFLDIDEDLLTAAAAASPPLGQAASAP